MRRIIALVLALTTTPAIAAEPYWEGLMNFMDQTDKAVALSARAFGYGPALNPTCVKRMMTQFHNKTTVDQATEITKRCAIK